MGGLLHLVQRGGAWAGCGPAQFPPRCTKCNSLPINGQCTTLYYLISAAYVVSECWLHWLLMGGLLHLVQRGGAWAGCGPAQAPPRCTKCNSPPINGQCTKLYYSISAAYVVSEFWFSVAVTRSG